MVTRPDWFIQVISNDKRTKNALRLARWAVLAVGIVAVAVVGLAIFAPVAAAGLLGGGSVVMAVLRRRR